MEKLMTVMSVQGTSTSASSFAYATSTSESVVGVRRERVVVLAGSAVRGGGELCPIGAVFGGAVRDADLPFLIPGTAVSGGPPA